MAKTRRNNATADILSVCLIHKILSYLSYDEASRMRIISKTWLQAWSTLPNLKFTISNFLEDTKIVDAIMERYRDENILLDKFEFSNCSKINSSSQTFPHIDKWLDMAFQKGVKDIVYEDRHNRLIRSYPFPIVKVLALKSLRELVLSGCDLMHVSLLSSGVVYSHSLRKLSLSHLKLDDNMLQTLLNSCPSIVSFVLEHCQGLKKLELSNLQKIKSISITAIGNEYAIIQAPTLEHLSYSDCASKTLEIEECQNLKSLELSNVKTFEGFLHKFQSLKVLKIQNCQDMRNFDSSNLVSFEYIGTQIPKLNMASEAKQLKHSKILLKCYNKLNAEWFTNLRKFLSNLISSSQVSLCFFECNKINIKDLHHGVVTPQVDILNVNIICPTTECPTFVEALLRSCHPRRLNLSSTVEMTKCFINCLMYMKSSGHSSSQRRKPWLSQLSEIKAFDEENQPLQLKNEELASTFTVNGRKEVYFLLDWQYC